MLHGSWVIARRELLAFFCSPIAYVVLVVFLGFNGYIFGFKNFVPGEEVSLRYLFSTFMPVVLMFIIPMLTMRLMSEEFRSGTIESLMTTPVSDAAVIAGKFLGTFFFYLFMLATTLVYVMMLMIHGAPDMGALVAGYMGLLLMGAFYISVGLFFSTCTSNQIVAVVTSFSLLAILAMVVVRLTQDVEGILRIVLQHISIPYQFGEFVQGAINMNNLVYFVSSTLLFLFVSVKVLESRRWR